MKKVLVLLCGVLMLAGAWAVAASAVPRASAARQAASGLDKEYLMTSMEGDQFEIRGGKLALKKSGNAAVRRLARQLIKDHTKSYGDAVKLAKAVGEPVETSASPSEQWELQNVAEMTGTSFNRWYSSLEVYDHRQDLAEASDEVQDGWNHAVREDARSEIPMLKMHLRLSKAAFKAS